MITVQLLGGACLRSGDVPLGGPPAQRHRIALLTLIVSAWPQPLSRDRAMALLWPERDLPNARRLLNLAVHVLRSALGEGAINSAGDALLLNPSLVRCDLHELRTAIASNDHDGVVCRYAGPLLDGFHLDDAADFGYWLDQQRAELHHAYVAALRAVAARQERAGDILDVIATMRRLTAADPHSAASALGLMRALDAAGDRAGAIQHAADYCRRLRDELELDPEPEVMALAEQMRRAPARHQEAAPAAPPPAGTVAVLPFRDLGPNADGDYFANGITEDVIAGVAKIRALTVIARASVMSFKQRDRDLKQIARALGATTVLDGTVRRVGNRVRVVANLIHADSGRHLWAETYDRDMTDIFAIQSDVALRIAEALKATLSADERLRVAREPTSDLVAYELLLRARQAFGRHTVDELQRAVEYLERAIARDPSYAEAHADLAMTCVELVEFGAIEPARGIRRALDAVAAASRLGPELSQAHCSMAYLKVVCEFDWEGSEREFLRALELSPSNADAYDLYGRLLAGVERYDEAIGALTRAHELDPLVHRVDLATANLRAGHYDEGVRLAEHAVAFDPSARALATLGWARFLTGRPEEGLSYLTRAAEASDENVWLAQLGEAYGLMGHEEQARAVLRILEERAERTYVSPYHLAYVHTGLGEADLALDHLEAAVDERAGAVFAIKGSFLLKPLRGHPRFHALLGRIKLE